MKKLLIIISMGVLSCCGDYNPRQKIGGMEVDYSYRPYKVFCINGVIHIPGNNSFSPLFDGKTKQIVTCKEFKGFNND